MSSRLTRLTGITAGTLISGGLLLGGAAPAFADTNSATVNATNTQSNTATVTQTATANANGGNATANGGAGGGNGGTATGGNGGTATAVNVAKVEQSNRFSIRVRQSGNAFADTNSATVNATNTQSNTATVDSDRYR